MMHGKVDVPEHIVERIDEYRHKVFNYFDSMVRSERLMDVDPFDPTIPGVAEEFILNRDPTDITFDGDSLVVNKRSKIYILYKPGKSVIDAIRDWVEEKFEGKTLRHISGHFFYPPDGGFMGWHTNSNQPNVRVYLTHASESDKSFFRYYDKEKKKVITDWDQKGWNARYFETPGDPNGYYWHCVYSKCDRLSIGLELEDK